MRRPSAVSSSVLDDPGTLWATVPHTQADHIVEVRVCTRLPSARMQTLFPGIPAATESVSNHNMSNFGPAEHQWNCLNCKRRKVRCDRQSPCANCIKGEQECVFPTSGRVFRRAETRVQHSGPRAKQLELMNRIRRLEKVVDGLNTELESQPARCGGSLTGSLPSHDMVCDISGSDGFAASLSYPGTPVQDNSTPNVGIPQDHRSQGSGGQRAAAPSEDRGSVYVGDHFWASLRREVSHRLID